MGKTKTKSASMRLRSLDGLRGVAAFAVLLSHIMLTAPVFASATYSPDVVMHPGMWEWWITYTPLHVLWAGHEAVYVFFVLSGFVLTLPVISRPAYSWRQYYPKRLVRLYAPVIAAVAFGVCTVLLVHRTNSAGLGDWLQDRPAAVTLWGMFKDVTLVAGPSRLISPLWSLQWEILFSLTLPLYVLFARRGHAGLKVAAILVAVGIGAWTGQQALIFMPMFAAGSLLAQHRDKVSRYVGYFGRTEWVSVLFVAVVLGTSRWTLPLLLPGERTEALATVPAFVGCALLVIVAAYSGGAKWLLELKFFQWLGTISFSLYLIHEPIVIALAFAFGPNATWLVALIAIPLSLAVGWLFFRLIEAPSHKLANLVGKAVDKPGKREKALVEV